MTVVTIGPRRVFAAIATTLFAGLALGDVHAATPVSCQDLTNLRSLGDKLTTVENKRTGDTLNYIVIGDGALSDELIVMFNGTGGVLADWPVQLITNRFASPQIVNDKGYSPNQNTVFSLCQAYRLVLFDYPGVGGTTLNGPMTGDRIADDVDAMLDDVADTYGISADKVNVFGWSLGTLLALKFAVLSPVANPSRTIGDVILIASKPGGSLDGQPNGNGAACVSTLFSALTDPDISDGFAARLRNKLFDLTFPYVGQQPYNGKNSGCTAKINKTKERFRLTVKVACNKNNLCQPNKEIQALNRETSPWSETDGVPNDVYDQQRQFVNDWNFCQCRAAGPNFRSRNCRCAKSQTIEMSKRNGGVCRTRARQVNRPASTNCIRLNIDGALSVINGKEDLFMQWKYGRALVDAYRRQYGPTAARRFTYNKSDGAGHGVLIQHPAWVQNRIHLSLLATTRQW